MRFDMLKIDKEAASSKASVWRRGISLPRAVGVHTTENRGARCGPVAGNFVVSAAGNQTAVPEVFRTPTPNAVGWGRRARGEMFERFMRPVRFGSLRVLVAGFGGLLVLMAVAGTYALLVLRQVQSRNEQIRQEFLSRTQALERIRLGIYLSETIARDYLLAPEPEGAAAQRDKLQSIRQETDQAMDAYTGLLDPAETAPFRHLQDEIHVYWNVLDLLSHRERRIRGLNTSYTYSELVQRRTTMLAIADRIAAINDQELQTSRRELDDAFRRFRFRLIVMFAVTFSAGLLLAAVVVVHVYRLEMAAQARYEETVRAQAELKELSARLVQAQEEERRAISRELHDEVGQSLSALLMEAGNVSALVPSSQELRPRLESIRKLAEGTMNVVRNMMLLLRPSMLDDFGLVPALQWQAREVSKRTGLRVHVSAEEVADDLPDEHKTCIYRVAQEALNNAARHAQAHAIEIAVRQEPHRILLTVSDDGRGFTMNGVRGFGLLGIEERVNHLGGVFSIQSQPGRGTELSIALPLAAEAVAGVNGHKA